MEAVLAHHFRVGVWGFDDVPHSAPVWLFGPHQPTTWLAVPEAPLLCSSMCPLLPLLSPPRIGSHARLFVPFTVSIDATRHRESCPSQLWVVSHLTRTATPLFLFCLPPRLNPPPLHPDAPPPPAPFAHLLLHVHDPCCTDVPSPCLEMSSLHRPTHHRRLMCPMSALMRSAAAGSIRADWSLQHCTGMEQACGEGANRGVHQGRVAVSTCHATELPVLEWPSAGQHQHTQTTKKNRETS